MCLRLCKWLLQLLGFISLKYSSTSKLQATTACNIQAALQLCGTNTLSQYLFFCFTKKMCMQLGTGSRVMLAPPTLLQWAESVSRAEDGHWCVVPTDPSDWLLSHSQRCTRKTESILCFSYNQTSDGIIALYFFNYIFMFFSSKS